MSSSIVFVLLGTPLLLAAPSDASRPRGVVVEEVAKGSAGEKAGMQPGDVILSWSRAANPPANPDPAQGTIDSPFELADIETEQAPRGIVTLNGTRGGTGVSATLAPGQWGIQSRPQMARAADDAYQSGRALLAQKDVEGATRLWRASAQQASAQDPTLACWLLTEVGNSWATLQRWDDAEKAYHEALGTSKEPLVLARVQTSLATVYRKRDLLDRMDGALQEALRLRRGLSAASLAVAASLEDLGSFSYYTRGDAGASAEPHFREALKIRETLAPESLAHARILNYIGGVLWARTDLSGAEDYFGRALALRERLAPDSPDVAGSLNNLGGLAHVRGRLTEAAAFYARALALLHRVAPDSALVSPIELNVGFVAMERGDLAFAEEVFERSFPILQRDNPSGSLTAGLLQHRAALAMKREDFALAEELHRRALSIFDAVAPEGFAVAAAYAGLGRVAVVRGEVEVAEGAFKKALSTIEKRYADTAWSAEILTELGGVLAQRGDHNGAVAVLNRALVIQDRLSPEGLSVAASLQSLGTAAEARGDLPGAEGFYRKALAIRERMAPGSKIEAESLHSIGLIHRRNGRLGLAVQLLRRAIDALELQKARLGGSEELKSAFAARNADFYQDLIEALVELGRAGEAFEILERSRARSLLAMLAERDLVFSGDIPPDLERERRTLDADYDQGQARLGALTPGKDAAEIDGLLGQMRELRGKQEAVAERIRRASPRLASLQYPRPLDLAGVQAALDPGTVLLSYAVGREKTIFFVVGSGGVGGLSVFTIPQGDQALRRDVRALRATLQKAAGRGSQSPAAAEGERLFTALMGAAEKRIASSARVLICPDGPLHALPFGALRWSGRYFVERKPFHVVVSGTVYDQLRRSGRDVKRTSSRLVAFGDPIYPRVSAESADEVASRDVRVEVMRGRRFEPLPATRREVEGIAELFPAGAGKYLGADATEERAKGTGREARYVHFACHGLLNERLPLNSALALTIPEKPVEGQENGLLQAWEIFERVRLDADLVTLSACDSGLGTEMGGEGLVGLTRAFQYAGARSVLASLWSVPDESTADLMKRFYGYLKDGKTKDEALRAAQVDFIRGPAASAHPFRWAAFQLIGDWK